MDPRPNILWISTHDINPHLGCYRGVWPGAEAAVTPNLDRLAGEGVRFDQAFATTPVCGPSRAALMTGCFPTSTGMHNMRSKAVPPPEVRLVSEYLRLSGYYTTNNVFTDFQVPTPTTAFDDCSPTAHWRGRPDQDTPFFAAFHGMATHESQIYVGEEAFADLTAGLPPEARHDPTQVEVPPYHLDDDAFRTAWARYHDLITVMDGWAGGILDDLEADGLLDNTVVVFWSDHGAGFPRAKRWATEAGLRIPLIVRWPGRISGGRSRTDVVHLMDLAPTMLELAGVDIPPHMQARSLFASDGSDRSQGRYAFGGRDRMDEQRDRSRTVRDERFRYIRHHHPDRAAMQPLYFAERFPTWRTFRTAVNAEARQLAAGQQPSTLTPLQRRVTGPAKPHHELYDISADPHETVDLAEDAAYAVDLERLSAELDDWMTRTGDLGAVAEEELILRWRPDGVIPTTAKPIVEEVGGTVRVSCPTPGALMAWTYDPPPPSPISQPLQDLINGVPEPDGRSWRVFRDELDPSGRQRWIRAWRLGFHGSPDTHIPPTSAEDRTTMETVRT